MKQDAQLSQRDRAAVCVIVFFWPKVEDWNWETVFYRHYTGLSSTTVTYNRPENLSN